MPIAQAMNLCMKAMVGSVFVMILAAVSLANDQQGTSAPETIEVYYDFIENGSLQGGTIQSDTQTVDTELSLMSAKALSDPVSNNSFMLLDNGPCDNRVDIVFVGDGYTADQMQLYRQHVETIANGILGESPLDRYASYFNIHVVEVISNESGVDEIDNNIYRDTALDMAFNDRQLSVDFTKAAAAASTVPAVDVIIVLANSSRYGGAGYTHMATVSAANSSSVELALHEFGHAFANLTDEYYPVDGSVYIGSEPTKANASIYTASELINSQSKWYRWLDVVGVDTFEGAKSKQYGIYRPVGTTKMNMLGYPFGPVNSEQFVFSIYDFSSPIDQATPATQEPILSDTQFSIECQSPGTDTLELKWQIDGVVVAGAAGRNFCPADAAEYLLPNTLQTLTVTVSDQTDLVRDETQRDTLMTDQRQWQIWTASADVAGGQAFGFLGLQGMMTYWLMDNPAYDIAPAGGDGIVDMLDFAAFAVQWDSAIYAAGDNVVDLYDLAGVMMHWLTDNAAYDIAPAGGDGIVDLQDFAVLATQWAGY